MQSTPFFTAVDQDGSLDDTMHRADEQYCAIQYPEEPRIWE